MNDYDKVSYEDKVMKFLVNIVSTSDYNKHIPLIHIYYFLGKYGFTHDSGLFISLEICQSSRMDASLGGGYYINSVYMIRTAYVIDLIKEELDTIGFSKKHYMHIIESAEILS